MDRPKRAKQGKPAEKYGLWVETASSVSEITATSRRSAGSAQAQAEVDKLKAELQAAEDVAQLERDAEAKELARQRELVDKRLALEKAEAVLVEITASSQPRSRGSSVVGSKANSVTGATNVAAEHPKRKVLTVEALAALEKRNPPVRKFATLSECMDELDIEQRSYRSLGRKPLNPMRPIRPLQSSPVEVVALDQNSDDSDDYEYDEQSSAGELSHDGSSAVSAAVQLAGTGVGTVASSPIHPASGGANRLPPRLTPIRTVASDVHPSIANAASSMRPQPVVTGPVSSALWKAPVAVPTQPKQPVLTAGPITVQSSLAAVPAAVQQPKQPTASKPRVPAACQTLLASAPAFQPMGTRSKVRLAPPPPEYLGAPPAEGQSTHPGPEVQSAQSYAIPYVEAPAIRSPWSRHHLKPLELPKFSGKDKDFGRWRQRFKQLVEEDTYMSDDHKFARLREALAGGEAEDLVADIVHGPGAYKSALQELDAWYGGPVRDIVRYERELLAVPRIVSERDLDQLKSFALRLRNTLINLNTAGLTPGRELYLSVTQKVPKPVLIRFLERHDDSLCDIHGFADFLLRRVMCLKQVEERAANPEPPQWCTEKRQQGPGKPFHKRTERTLVATESSTVSCVSCRGGHQLASCPQFKQLSLHERWEFVKPLTICICCFKPGHKGKDCRQPRCRFCNKPHHELLHYQKSIAKQPVQSAKRAPCANTAQGRVEKAQSACSVTATSSSSRDQTTAFMTVAATINGPNGPSQATVFLDSGSSCSFISADLVERLALPVKFGSLETSVLGGEKLCPINQYATVELSHSDGSGTSEFSAWVLPKIMNPITTINWTEQQGCWPHLTDVPLPKVPEAAPVGLLVGLNAPWLHTSLEERFANEGGPIARKTLLGWVVFGSVSAHTAGEFDDRSLVATSDDPLTEVVSKFWQLESVGMETTSSDYLTPDERAADDMTKRSLHHNGTRFVVGIPWRSGADQPELRQDSRQCAEQRLKSLHRILERKPEVRLQYAEVLKKYLERGYIRSVLPTEVEDAGTDQWFLPHFPVIRNDKSTTKVRIVFDGSAKVMGDSINDRMHAGQKLQSDLVKVLLRFCHHPIALTADISEMFLQVELRDNDRKYHRFVWSESPHHPLVFFEFCRVVFGMRASPYLVGRALQATAETFADTAGPEAINAVRDNFYVDDLLMSTATEASAIVAREDLQEITTRGGFHLRKWLSNSPAVLKSIPEADLSDEELHTALVHAEGLINSRPLTVISSDPNDLRPLTPQHFLVGHADTTLAAELGVQPADTVHPRRRWMYVQRIVAEVWARWVKEIVPKLNLQVKWFFSSSGTWKLVTSSWSWTTMSHEHIGHSLELRQPTHVRMTLSVWWGSTSRARS
ncbi:uncharacterized protein LOC135816784 [Sycon ciliatum]|uniref:uncharacterized protein LOC135816784 n=1 Tax=Sycon ciliatum TaxID=27933 RepID=UPI0031F67C71